MVCSSSPCARQSTCCVVALAPRWRPIVRAIGAQVGHRPHSGLERRDRLRHRAPHEQAMAVRGPRPRNPSADDPDVRWLSYSQIAALRGISRASAERMVRKHRWRRTQNNHGVTVAAVPLDYAEPSAATPPEQAAAPSADRGVAEAFERALAAVEAARSAEASALRERAEWPKRAPTGRMLLWRPNVIAVMSCACVPTTPRRKR